MLERVKKLLWRGAALSAISPTGLSCEALEREEMRRRWRAVRSRLAAVGLNAAAIVLLFFLAAQGLNRALVDTRGELQGIRGEKVLLELQVERLSTIQEHSARYEIPADLAATIFDAAVGEGLEPELAFRLVEIESSFRQRAVSPAGAIGYTQLRPSTARTLEPGVTEADLFDPETNLRLGFRYLVRLLERYDGDLRLALLAYNRGPTRVGELLAEGEDPGNGYARRVIGE